LVNAFGIDNDEDGTEMDYCVPRRPWKDLWSHFVHLG
jgi:hypothetical protein